MALQRPFKDVEDIKKILEGTPIEILKDININLYGLAARQNFVKINI